MCHEAVRIESVSLAYVPDRFKRKNARNLQRGSAKQAMLDIICP